MNKDILQGNWTEIKGKLKKTWGKLTDDDLQEIDGRKEELLGKLQKRYGYSKDKAEEELKNFETTCCSSTKSCSSEERE